MTYFESAGIYLLVHKRVLVAASGKKGLQAGRQAGRVGIYDSKKKEMNEAMFALGIEVVRVSSPCTCTHVIAILLYK